MKTGTKSLLFGVHQFLWHPFTVWLAWRALYGKFPKFWECVAIFFHDWGYFGCDRMDDAHGEMHPVRSAMLVEKLMRFFGKSSRETLQIEWLICFHSRYLSARHDIEPSRLAWPDKLCMQFDPQWFYLLRARLSGELTEYRANASKIVPLTEPNSVWFQWIRAKCTDAALNRVKASSRKTTAEDTSKAA
jgi:hypothetical protein